MIGSFLARHKFEFWRAKIGVLNQLANDTPVVLTATVCMNTYKVDSLDLKIWHDDNI